MQVENGRHEEAKDIKEGRQTQTDKKRNKQKQIERDMDRNRQRKTEINIDRFSRKWQIQGTERQRDNQRQRT